MEVINKDWLLLDTCSTVSVSCNPRMISNVKPCGPGKGVTVITNGGAQTFEEEGILNFLPLKVHFNENSVANILSLSDVANLPGATLKMDTSVARAINLSYNNVVYRFNECADGLYYHNPFDTNDNKKIILLLPTTLPSLYLLLHKLWSTIKVSTQSAISKERILLG